MNGKFWPQVRAIWQTEFFTPKDFVKRALMIAVAFGIVHLLGLREYTSILNGTIGSLTVSRETAIFLGLTYVILYFAAVILCPIFLIGAGLLAAWRRFSNPTRPGIK